MKKLLPLSLLVLAGCSALDSDGATYGADEATAGAAFRAQAAEVVGKLKPVCPFSENADQLARYEEPAARYQAVKDWVAKTPFKIDLAIAESSYEQYWKVREVECGPTDTEESIAQLDAELNALNQQLDGLEKLAGVI